MNSADPTGASPVNDGGGTKLCPCHVILYWKLVRIGWYYDYRLVFWHVSDGFIKIPSGTFARRTMLIQLTCWDSSGCRFYVHVGRTKQIVTAGYGGTATARYEYGYASADAWATISVEGVGKLPISDDAGQFSVGPDQVTFTIRIRLLHVIPLYKLVPVWGWV